MRIYPNKENNTYLIFVLICFVILSTALAILQIVLALPATSILFKAISIFADSSLICLPFLFFRGRWRILLPISVTVIIILIEVNSIYFRNFGDLIAAPLYFSNFGDPVIAEGAVATLTWQDALPLLLIAFVWIFFFILGREGIFRSKIGQRFKIITSGVTLLLWVITFMGSYRRTGIHKDVAGFGNVLKEMTANRELSWQNYYMNRNFTGYLFTCLLKSFNVYHPLSPEDETFIKERLSNRKTVDFSFAKTDTLERNLIVVVVESLQSNVFDFPVSKEVMPYLSSLASDSLNVFVKECKVLTGAGRSSDGQFIINTGLLPLRGEALVTSYAAGNYPSLAKAFNGESVEVIGERKSLWSHGVTNVSYGYDRWVSDLVIYTPRDQDSIIFHQAIAEVKRLRQPFFLFVTSISMHDPYLVPRVTPHLQESVLSSFADPRDKEYLRRLNHFDSQLGLFIDFLKKEGLYDDTIVVITGDHDISPEDISEGMHCETVPLIILNSGRYGEYRTQDVTQLDIFPTVLSLINPDYRYERFDIPYSGLGSDIFIPGSQNEIPEDDYRVSELIIRSGQ